MVNYVTIKPLSHTPMALEGVRVLDAATILAGPAIGMVLGDFGADVIKIEHPKGDGFRVFGYHKNGVPLFWKVINRNKRCITLNLGLEEGKKIFLRLVAGADVLIENFRPGTLERWGLGWEVLSQTNPRLVMTRVTGFGQTGPMARRPGFGTVAEAMSGFAHINGDPAGPPMLPPVGLADTIAAYYGVFAIMFALYERDARGSGKGQVIDLSIYEPLFSALGYQTTLYDQLGFIQKRVGNQSAANAPRGVYRTGDGCWVAVSAAAPSITKRVLTLTGGEAVANDPRFQTSEGRRAHSDELDRIVGDWIGERTLKEVIDAFDNAEAAVAPVYDIAQILHDPQYRARDDVITVMDDELGGVRMQNVFPFLSRTPGKVRFTGRHLGEHNREIYAGELGIAEEELARLHAEGVI